MTTGNFCFYLQNRLIQTSQTGGQWYSDTSHLSIPWGSYSHYRLSVTLVLDLATRLSWSVAASKGAFTQAAFKAFHKNARILTYSKEFKGAVTLWQFWWFHESTFESWDVNVMQALRCKDRDASIEMQAKRCKHRDACFVVLVCSFPHLKMQKTCCLWTPKTLQTVHPSVIFSYLTMNNIVRV